MEFLKSLEISEEKALQNMNINKIKDYKSMNGETIEVLFTKYNNRDIINKSEDYIKFIYNYFNKIINHSLIPRLTDYGKYLKSKKMNIWFNKDNNKWMEKYWNSGILYSGAIADMAKKMQLIKDNDVILEFGVGKGTSICSLSKALPNNKIYGFDHFDGLPESDEYWVKGEKSNTNGLIKFKIPKNVVILKGLFEDTLHKFTEKKNIMDNIKFIHMDCDLYSSSFTVFSHLFSYIKKGTIISFDDSFFYKKFYNGEILAFYQLLNKINKDFKVLCSWVDKVTIMII